MGRGVYPALLDGSPEGVVVAAKKREEFYCTSETCIAALRTRFASNEYVLFEQFGGIGTSRYADAVAMNLWPSRGLAIHGFEVKVSRSDWKKELNQPEKSAPIQKFCDFWHIVAPEGLVDEADLPPAWGLLEVTPKQKLVTRVKAPKLESVPVTRAFVAMLLRSQFEVWDLALRAARDEGFEKGAEKGNGEIVARLERDREHHKTLREHVAAFEQASGLQIQFGWQHKEMGEAVRLLMNARHRIDTIAALKRDAEAYERRLATIREDIATLEAVRTPEAAE